MKVKVFDHSHEVKGSMKNIRKSVKIAKWAMHLSENEKSVDSDDSEMDFILKVMDTIQDYFKNVIKLNKKDLEKLDDLELDEAMELLAKTVQQVNGGEAAEKTTKK